MTRRKVKVQYIINDAARKAVFKKRKMGLLKKANELSTLCGIEMCAFIYSPFDNESEVWPSTVGAQHVLERFQSLPEVNQTKKMVDQERFLKQRIAKTWEQLKKVTKDNREKKTTHLMHRASIGNNGTAEELLLSDLKLVDLNDLDGLIDQYVKEIDHRIDALKISNDSSPPSMVATSSIRCAPNEQQQHEVNEVSVKDMNLPHWLKNILINSNDRNNGGADIAGGNGFFPKEK